LTIELEQSKKHLADDSSANTSQMLAGVLDLRLPQDVEPQRRRLRGAVEFGCRQDLFPYEPGHVFDLKEARAPARVSGSETPTTRHRRALRTTASDLVDRVTGTPDGR
jgi:hypothetical protein